MVDRRSWLYLLYTSLSAYSIILSHFWILFLVDHHPPISGRQGQVKDTIECLSFFLIHPRLSSGVSALLRNLFLKHNKQEYLLTLGYYLLCIGGFETFRRTWMGSKDLFVICFYLQLSYLFHSSNSWISLPSVPFHQIFSKIPISHFLDSL